MARVKLRPIPFESMAHELGLTNKTEQARRIGVHRSVHSRALIQERELSAAYALGVLSMAGDDTVRRLIRRLFEIEDAA